MFERVPAPLFWIIIAGYLALVLFIIFGWQLVFGQDFDPCFVDNDMYQRVCDQQQIDKVIDSLLERAREWNAR